VPIEEQPMTLAQVGALRDKYYNALMALDTNQLTHSIDGASYDHDSHRDSLEKSLEYWDTMYNTKLNGGRTLRLGKKAV